MYRIDDNLKEFVESGVAIVVGTGDASGRPHIAHGWAPRVLGDRNTIEVFLEPARTERTLADLRANGRIAMTLVDPISYRSVQFKGKYEDIGEPNEADHAFVQERREGFVTVTSLIGDPPDLIRNLWLPEVVRVSFTVEIVFDQTPGPDAGKPL